MIVRQGDMVIADDRRLFIHVYYHGERLTLADVTLQASSCDCQWGTETHWTLKNCSLSLQPLPSEVNGGVIHRVTMTASTVLQSDDDQYGLFQCCHYTCRPVFCYKVSSRYAYLRCSPKNRTEIRLLWLESALPDDVFNLSASRHI